MKLTRTRQRIAAWLDPEPAPARTDDRTPGEVIFEVIRVASGRGAVWERQAPTVRQQWETAATSLLAHQAGVSLPEVTPFVHNPPKPPPARPCDAKIRFATEFAAHGAMRRFRRRGVGVARAYYCHPHDCWHLTSMGAVDDHLTQRIVIPGGSA